MGMSAFESLVRRLRWFGVFPFTSGHLSLGHLAVSLLVGVAVLCSALWLARRGPSVTIGTSARLLYLLLFYSRQLVKLLLFPLTLSANLLSRQGLSDILAELAALDGRMTDAGLRSSPPPTLPTYALRLHLSLGLLAFLAVFLPYIFMDSLITLPQGFLTFTALLASTGLTHCVDSCLFLLSTHFVRLHFPLLPRPSLLEPLVDFHNRLCLLSLRLNRLLDVQLVFLISMSFLTCVIYLYYVIFVHTVNVQNPIQFFAIVTHYAAVGLANFLFVVSIVYNTTLLSKQANEFTVRLYRVMLEDTTREVSSNVKLRLHISNRRDLVFTASGFFNIDHHLIHSMVAASTTYLVILVQFGQMIPSPAGRPSDGTEGTSIYPPTVPQ